MRGSIAAEGRRLKSGAASFLVAAASVLLFATPQVAAAGVISVALFSPDISVTIGSVPFTDEGIAFEDFSTPISPFVPIPLPDNADVIGCHVDEVLAVLYFSIDITAGLAGPLTVTPRDIVAYDGVTFSVAFDGDAAGIPPGARIDAISIDPLSGDFVVSFDGTVELGGTTFADEDLVLLNGGSPSMFLDGDAVGLASSLDIDGASALGDQAVALSLDGSGSVGGVDFDDEDIILYMNSQQAGARWYMAYDASSHAPEMQGGPDSNAILVPEPTAWLAWTAGVAALAALAHRRRHRSTAAAAFTDRVCPFGRAPDALVSAG